MFEFAPVVWACLKGECVEAMVDCLRGGPRGKLKPRERKRERLKPSLSRSWARARGSWVQEGQKQGRGREAGGLCMKGIGHRSLSRLSPCIAQDRAKRKPG